MYNSALLGDGDSLFIEGIGMIAQYHSILDSYYSSKGSVTHDGAKDNGAHTPYTLGTFGSADPSGN